MADPSKNSKLLTRVAVAAFALVTAAMLLPGYVERWSTEPPQDAEFYVKQAFDTRLRVYDEDGRFGRLASDVSYGRVTSFSCQGSAAARREFGWRGAKELIFDCPATFEDADGRGYSWVFRLITDEAALTGGSPEGYRALHTPEEEAFKILKDIDLYP